MIVLLFRRHGKGLFIKEIKIYELSALISILDLRPTVTTVKYFKFYRDFTRMSRLSGAYAREMFFGYFS